MRDGAGVAVIDVNYRHCPGGYFLVKGLHNVLKVLYRSSMG